MGDFKDYDKDVILRVGGKDFHTKYETLWNSPEDCVFHASVKSNLLKGELQPIIYYDRNSKHFDIILDILRKPGDFWDNYYHFQPLSWADNEYIYHELQYYGLLDMLEIPKNMTINQYVYVTIKAQGRSMGLRANKYGKFHSVFKLIKLKEQKMNRVEKYSINELYESNNLEGEHEIIQNIIYIEYCMYQLPAYYDKESKDSMNELTTAMYKIPQELSEIDSSLQQILGTI